MLKVVVSVVYALLRTQGICLDLTLTLTLKRMDGDRAKHPSNAIHHDMYQLLVVVNQPLTSSR